MRPPFEITSTVNLLVAQISRYLGNYEAISEPIPSLTLRKKNRVRTIKSTLSIEGNTLTEDQITTLFEGKKILGKPKEILEVKNAIKLYESVDHFTSTSITSLKSAHKILMQGLILSAGEFRTKNVGILQGSKVKHIAPKSIMVHGLIDKLFTWHKTEKNTHPLIKSCILHYELEFIHPFEDGNGRMGRFWQTLVLAEFEEIFKYLPIESLIEKNQQKYYKVLEICDKKGTSTAFIEFMLEIILETLKEFITSLLPGPLNSNARLEKASKQFVSNFFSKRDYLLFFKTISSATASRDLKEGVEKNILKTRGEKNQTKYKFIILNS